MRILIVVNPEKRRGSLLAERIKSYLKRRKIKCDLLINEGEKKEGDVVISVGGDGTLLKAFHIFPHLPICGIHVGKLGFLAHIDYEKWKTAVDAISEGKYKIVKKTLLEMKLAKRNYFALNDIVLATKFPGRLIEYNMMIKGEVLNFLSDGLIVSTPTGSTAYNFANYGPVVDEKTEGMILNPLVPHNISFRPIVLSKKDRVKVYLGKKTKRASFWIDGQREIEFFYGEFAEFFVSRKKCNFLVPEGFEFNLFKRLKEKLRWQ